MVWNLKLSCPGCLRLYQPGDPACPACGSLLESLAAPAPSLAGYPPLTSDAAPPELQQVCVLTLEMPITGSILCLGKPTRQVRISPGKEYLIGRSDPVNGFYPEIDLRNLPNAEFTHRRHARLVMEGEALVITDLNDSQLISVNGSGRPLARQAATRLLPGDCLMIAEVAHFRVNSIPLYE